MTRIVAGSRGGQRLATPKGSATRPTSERVREAFFSALATWSGAPAADVALDGLTFVDLWAGSGAMGLEAASRGATQVLCVEKDRPTAELISRNAKTLALPVQVRTATVESVLAAPAPFGCDVVWGDPPYDVATEHLDALVPSMLGWLAPQGLLVLERSRRAQPPQFGPDVAETWSRRYGETTLYYAMTGA